MKSKLSIQEIVCYIIAAIFLIIAICNVDDAKAGEAAEQPKEQCKTVIQVQVNANKDLTELIKQCTEAYIQQQQEVEKLKREIFDYNKICPRT